MKLIILLAVASVVSCDKLDRTYLPPAYAQTSGGSGNFLQTPNFSKGPGAGNAFAQNGNGIAQNGNRNGQGVNEYAQNGNGLVQAGNGFSQAGNDFSQAGNDFYQAANDFTQAGNDFSQTGNDFSQNDASGFQRAERPRAAFERTASILRQDSQNDGETYSYSFETENGITAEESGVATNGVEAQGGFSYVGDDGQVYSIRYTADQNGYVPQGDHLPTPPPIPEEILKALEQNARDEANGIFDDGSFQEGKYADSEADNGNQNYNNNGNQNYAGGNQNLGGNFNDNFARDDDTIVTNSAATNTAYLPPLSNQSPIIGSQRPENANRPQNGNNQPQGQNPADLTNSYLPPLENQSPIRNQRPEIANQRLQNGNQRQNSGNPTNSYIPPLGNQRDDVRNQRPTGGIQRQTVANTAYLSPLDNQRASARNQRPQVSQRNFAAPQQNNFGSNGVTNAYLPPRDQTRSDRRPAGFNGQVSPQRSSNNGFAASPVSNGFGQRNIQRPPNFNARDGYQY